MLQITGNETADTDTAQIARGPPWPQCYDISTSNVAKFIDKIFNDCKTIYHHIANNMMHYRLLKSKLQHPTACCPVPTMLLCRCRETVRAQDDVRSHENMATDIMPQNYPAFTHSITLAMPQGKGRQPIHQLHLCRHHTAGMAQSRHTGAVMPLPVRNKRISPSRQSRSVYAPALRSTRLPIFCHSLRPSPGGPAYVSYRRSASILTGRRVAAAPSTPGRQKP